MKQVTNWPWQFKPYWTYCGRACILSMTMCCIATSQRQQTKLQGKRAHLELLVINRTEIDICFHRLTRDSRSEHVLAGVIESVINKDLRHVFHL